MKEDPSEFPNSVDEFHILDPLRWRIEWRSFKSGLFGRLLDWPLADRYRCFAWSPPPQVLHHVG